MEAVAYKVADCLGFGELFVPTETFGFKTDTDEKRPPPMQWRQDKDGKVELVKYDPKTKVYGGSVQQVVKGVPFEKYCEMDPEGRPEITKETINKATVASLVFGMFDAHGNNILITDDGEMKFFDNSRSLPNSNDFITHFNGLQITYRSALLSMEESYIPLKEDELLEIKDQLEHAKNQLSKMTSLLEEAENKVLPGWIDSDGTTEGVKERIDNMLSAIENAIDEEGDLTLDDLVSAAIPSYKLVCCMTYLADSQIPETFDEDYQREVAVEIGYDHLETVVHDFIDNTEIDPREMEKFVDRHSDLTAYEIAKLALRELDEPNGELRRLSSDELEHNEDLIDAFCEKAFDKANFDGKDRNAQEIKEDKCSYAERYLEHEGFRINTGLKEESEDGDIYISKTDPSKIYYCQERRGRMHYTPLDYTDIKEFKNMVGDLER